MRLNHVLIYVADVERALEFYEGKLGFKRVETDLPGYARVVVSEGDATIGLHKVGSDAAPPWNEGVRLYLELDDLDAFCEHLSGLRVSFEQPPSDMPWGWRHAYLKDPDGHLLSLYHAGEKRLSGTS